MTVGQLRAVLDGVPDDFDVTVRASDDDRDQWVCGGIEFASVEYAHDDDCTPFFAIDASADVKPTKPKKARRSKAQVRK